MGCEGAKDAAQGGEEGDFGVAGFERVVRGGFEVDVVWEGAVKIAFYRFFIVIREAEFRRSEETGVEVRVQGEVDRSTGIVEPSSATPGRRKAFQHETLCLWRTRREDSRLIYRKVAIAHVALPFSTSPFLAGKVFATPEVVLGKSDVVVGFEEAVLVSAGCWGHDGRWTLCLTSCFCHMK